MADRESIAWLAGLLEGEGCFYQRPGRVGSFIVQLMMTDKDVVIRAAEVMQAHKVTQTKKPTKSGKKIYRAIVYGKTAINVMRRVRPFMGRRRAAKIDEIMEIYWNRPRSSYPERKPFSKGAKVVWLRTG